MMGASPRQSAAAHFPVCPEPAVGAPELEGTVEVTLLTLLLVSEESVPGLSGIKWQREG